MVCRLGAVRSDSKRNPYVTDSDRGRLGRLLISEESYALGDRRSRGALEAKLEQAKSVQPNATPQNLVTMNTTLRLADLASEEMRTITLVYPDDVDLAADGVSILQPLGTAILGCHVGDVVECAGMKGNRRFRVDEVVFQPEQARAFHL